MADNLQGYPVSFTLFMPNGLFYHNSLDRFISYVKGVWLVYIIIIIMCGRNILT